MMNPIGTEAGYQDRANHLASLGHQKAIEHLREMLATRIEAHDVMGDDVGTVVDYNYLRVCHTFLGTLGEWLDDMALEMREEYPDD